MVETAPVASVETVTILFTDLVGSTSLESQVGPVRADELRDEHFALLREAIASTDGAREVKNTGDGVMLALPSAAAAAECATKMQQGFERRNRGSDETLAIRIGISMGDATCEAGDYFGMPVIEAARLCDKAEGGGILVPELVKLMMGGRGTELLRPAGTVELKGIPDPVTVYEIAWEPLAAEETGPAAALPPRLMGVPPLGYVGREAERDLIGSLWRDAVAGQRRVGLVSGEPGIGKTRIVTHCAIERHADGATVLYGRCEEDLATPFGPWIEALSHLVDRAPDDLLAAHVARHGGELTRLLPGFERRVPDAPPPRDSDPETERYLVFAAVAGLLAEAAAHHPVLLLLDDLHWADQSTLALIKHVVSTSTSQPLLLLGTYRDSELSSGHPLTGTLADLRREEGVERIALTGLEEVDVVAILEATAGHEMDKVGRRLAEEIAAESGGNPFFVGELLRHLTESGTLVQDEGGRWRLTGELGRLGLPQSVREVIGKRVERLGESATRTLTAAAVIGRDFDVDLLTEVVDVGEDDLLDMLEEACVAGVLVERTGRPGSFTFAHALINQALYDELGATRRARLHRRVAEALESLCGDDPGARVAELANHWSAATASVDPAKALDYTVRAGRRAIDDLAPDEAIRWFGQALELHGQLEDPDQRQRCEILIGLGEAQRHAGDSDFRQTLLDAAAIAGELGDAELLTASGIANNRGFMGASGFVDHEVIAVLERALELVDEDDLRRRATLVSLLALELMWDGDYERRRELADQALDLARRSNNEHTLAWSLWRRFNPIAVPETLAERKADAEELGEVAERLGDPVLRVWAAIYGTTPAMETGDRDRFEECLERTVRIAEEVGQPVPRWIARWLEAVRDIADAELERAEQSVEDAAQLGSDSGQPDALTFYVGQLFSVRWAQDGLGELEDLIAQSMEDNPDLSPFRALFAFLLCDLGRPDEARALLDPVAAAGFASVPRDMLWSTTMTQWAEVAAETASEDAGRRLLELLEPWADQFPTTSITLWMPIAHYTGRLRAMLGDHDAADSHFARAIELGGGFRSPMFAAASRLAWGRALIERGEVARGQELAG